MSEKPDGIPTPADFFGWLNQMMSFPTNLAASMASATQTPGGTTQLPDPLALWKNFTEKNEEAWAKFMQQMVATPEFAQALGQSANSAAAYKLMIKQTAKTYLETAGMPSRDDLTHLAEQIVSLDAKVDDLGDTFNDSLGTTPQLINRVVSTLESLATRLERLEAKMLSRDELAGINQRLEALESKVPGKAELNSIAERIGALEKVLEGSLLQGKGETQKEVVTTTEPEINKKTPAKPKKVSRPRKTKTIES